MDKSSVITLISVEYEIIPPGIEEKIETKQDIFCTRKSATRNDFYAAGTEGLKPSLVFVVYAFEYNGERTVIYDGQRYEVIRTYELKGEKLELHVSEVVGIEN